jgi:hypothetical protein
MKPYLPSLCGPKREWGFNGAHVDMWKAISKINYVNMMNDGSGYLEASVEMEECWDWNAACPVSAIVAWESFGSLLLSVE